MSGRKAPKQLERYMKGVANHRRIEILMLLAKEEGIGVDAVATRLDCNMKTISEHLRRLTHAGLIEKKYQGPMVGHFLTSYGKTIHKFLQSF